MIPFKRRVGKLLLNQELLLCSHVLIVVDHLLYLHLVGLSDTGVLIRETAVYVCSLRRLVVLLPHVLSDVAKRFIHQSIWVHLHLCLEHLFILSFLSGSLTPSVGGFHVFVLWSIS